MTGMQVVTVLRSINDCEVLGARFENVIRIYSDCVHQFNTLAIWKHVLQQLVSLVEW